MPRSGRRIRRPYVPPRRGAAHFTPAAVLIIAGRRDRAGRWANAEFLDERLPNGKLVVVDAGHFVWEERAGGYAALIADWVTGGYCEAAARGPAAAVMSQATDGGNDELEQ